MSASNVTAIVLAAGHARRMGDIHKLVALVQDKPVIRYTVENILHAHVGHVMVITGDNAGRIEAALQGLPVSFLNNGDHECGIASSLVCGVSALNAATDAAVVCLGDMPLVRPRVIERLIAAFDSGDHNAICVPTYQSVQGNPILWANSFFSDLQKLQGDQGAKKLLSTYAPSVLRINMPDEPGIVFDIDTPADLIQFDAILSA